MTVVKFYKDMKQKKTKSQAFRSGRICTPCGACSVTEGWDYITPTSAFLCPAQLLWRHFLLQSDRVSRHRGRDTLWGHACQPWTPLSIVKVDKDKYTEPKANTKIPKQIQKVPHSLTSFAFLGDFLNKRFNTILQNIMISL